MKHRLMMAALSAVMTAGFALTPYAASAATPAPKTTAPAVKKIEMKKLKFKYTTDKDAVSYKIGEKMIFTFSVEYEGGPLPEDLYLRWTRSGDDGIMRIGLDSIAPGKPVVIETSLDRPGFVHINASLTKIDGQVLMWLPDGNNRLVMKYEGGAGANVDEILPARKEPADFDVFWKKLNAELAKVPVKAQMVKLPKEKLNKKYKDSHDVFTVKVDCAGKVPVTGFLLMPADAKAKSLPVQVNFDGYGFGAQGEMPAEWTYLASKDKVIFYINAHGYDLLQDKAYYKEFFKTRDGYAFSTAENANPETSYFYGMAMRVIRAFDFVKTLPQWNGKDLIAYGGSQGGLQSSWAGSQVKGLTQCKPHVTWCTDIAGTSIGRMGGWRPVWAPGLDYYDTAFHAPRIPASCQLDITRAGLGDYVCPPSGVATQYNLANCPKKIRWMQNSTHMEIPLEKQVFLREAPAGKGIKGVAAKIAPAKLPEVNFVSAKFEPEWTLFIPSQNKTIPLHYTGSENLRNPYKLKTMDVVVLKGTLMADADGWVLLGTGADWWWHTKVNGNWVYGRTLSTPGANGNSNFKKTDWIYRAPVKKGANAVELEVVLGEHGTVSFGTMTPADASNEISKLTYEYYLMFRDQFPLPDEKKPVEFEKNAWSWLLGSLVDDGSLNFTTVQPYPAAVEYRLKGDAKAKWKAVWDPAMSCDHKVKLTDVEPGKEYEVRTIQTIFKGGWENFRSPVSVMKF